MTAIRLLGLSRREKWVAKAAMVLAPAALSDPPLPDQPHRGVRFGIVCGALVLVAAAGATVAPNGLAG